MSLDIDERQILLYFAADAVPWHHRVLLVQIRDAVWVVATPDFDIQVLDMSNEIVHALVQGRRACRACSRQV